jgi:type III restriction enzyme
LKRLFKLGGAYREIIKDKTAWSSCYFLDVPPSLHAIPSKERFRIVFPRVEGYTQAIRNRITLDWEDELRIFLDSINIPPEVQMKAAVSLNSGRPSLTGSGKLRDVSLNPFRKKRRKQELVFELATDLTKEYSSRGGEGLSPHVLFPQLVSIVERYLEEKIVARAAANLLDVFLSPYYGWVVERLRDAIRPDTSQGEIPEVPKYEKHRGPGSTDEVDFWTSKKVREVERSHLNYAVADTKKREQSAAYFIDTHPLTAAFVKNMGLGFAVPYFHNGQAHDYLPDFIVRLHSEESKPVYMIIETKGFDPLEGVKRAAAERWVKAVNSDGQFGHWQYAVARRPEEVKSCFGSALNHS